jgi:hypothetical protein
VICTCGKGDNVGAVAHSDDCPVSDWVFGELEGTFDYSRVTPKGGKMSESIDFNEEKDNQEGGSEFEEIAKKEKAKDPDTLATPTELVGGGSTGDSTGQSNPA